MKLTNPISAFCILLLPSAALGADCFPDGGDRVGLPWGALTEAAWDARRRMCDNIDCGYQKNCTTKSGGKTASSGNFKWRADVNLDRWTTGGQGFSECWKATEGIIQKCILSGKTSGGTSSYNGQQYRLSMDVRVIKYV
ncbi:hypothetical protein GE09DRAFT_1228334 [Coniochaeta sp. 2T2.1]|nr:hypothetical protein GE09DRAFT_1228334 [Coniochaeta sp. 2T2.1]